MYTEKTIHHNPIDLLNENLKEFGYMKNIYNNPLSLLLHMFYSYGNGYEFIEHGGETVIVHDKVHYEEGEQEKNSMVDLYTETKKNYEMLLERSNSDYYEKMLKELNVTDETFKKMLKFVKSDLDKLEESFDPRFFDMKPLESLEDLRSMEFDVDNVYWKNLNNIVTRHSMAAKIPDNLSPEWKKAFDIVTDKMIEVDRDRVETALKNTNKRR